ncbi:unnamed protein product [Phytophthora lilii]|uniref:Unnamed protein product n=1 Tax=Phytophthora lilii TaxID=2077276 RepID=A0A9W6WPP3_9STRA|nr:unnamed protein product [Phytophthora lilii]
MAPLTRVRTGEATNISPTARGYFGAPGRFHNDQVASWKPVTKAIHDKGGKVYVQLWHTGRVGHPLNQLNGQLPVSSSATSMDNAKRHAVTREGRKDYVTPRALDISEIPSVVADHKRAAENAIATGFDGVESTLPTGTCSRSSCATALPCSKVGICLSPSGDTFGCKDSNPRETYGYVVKKLNDYDLAYLHVIERRGMHADNAGVPAGGVANHFRGVYKGVLITAAGFDRADAMQTVENGVAATSSRTRTSSSVCARTRSSRRMDQTTFYVKPDTKLEAGYTDYPLLGKEDKGVRTTEYVYEPQRH